jgi:hypothetical protein
VENEGGYDMQKVMRDNINRTTLQKLTLNGETSKELIL